jgi:adenosine deaminase
VPHAGEGAGGESVRACVELLGARRINHGVRAVEDPAVVDLLIERGVSLDVCPTSNVALQVAPSLEAHPLPALLDAGVPVSLNTDCPLFLDTTTVDEYALASSAFGLGPDQLAAIARTSLETSSCPADRRDRALAALGEWQPAG